MYSVSFFGVNATETYKEYMKKYPNAQLILKDKPLHLKTICEI